MNVKLLRTIDPKILVPVEELKKMVLYGEMMKGEEVAWLGFVERVDTFTFRISKVFLLDQEVTSTTVDISVDAQAAKITEMLDGGLPPEDVAKIRFHGHWHPHNSTTPSYTDETQLKEFMEVAKDFFIYAIATPKGDWKYIVTMIEMGIELEDVPWEIEFQIDEEALKAQVKEELEKHVKKKEYKSYKYSSHNYEQWDSFYPPEKKAIGFESGTLGGHNSSYSDYLDKKEESRAQKILDEIKHNKRGRKPREYGKYRKQENSLFTAEGTF